MRDWGEIQIGGEALLGGGKDQERGVVEEGQVSMCGALLSVVLFFRKERGQVGGDVERRESGQGKGGLGVGFWWG